MIKRTLIFGALFLGLVACEPAPSPPPVVTVLDGETAEISTTVEVTAVPALDSSEEWFPLEELTFAFDGREVRVEFTTDSLRYAMLKEQEGGVVNGVRRGAAEQAKKLLPGRDLLGEAKDAVSGGACEVIKATTDYAVVERCEKGDLYKVTLAGSARVDVVLFTDNSANRKRPNRLAFHQKVAGTTRTVSFDMRR